MAVKNVSKNEFSAETKQGVVLVDFWAPWCGPCKQIAPILDEVDQQLGEKVKVVKVNVDEEPELAGKYGVMSIPSLCVLKDGEPVDKIVGLHSKDAIIQLLNKHS